MQKLRKGDTIVVLAGKDKGKTGSIIKMIGANKAVVQNINLIKKHEKANPMKGISGGIVEREMPIHLSNIAIYNFTTKKADKIGSKFDEENNKTRIYKSTGEIMEA
ncbi:MAG: 50S ribosomal protein L24 [Nitrosomonas sp.]|nr:MAG: 50S ribosomal protein L24 [Nitrosomonas sp.]